MSIDKENIRQLLQSGTAKVSFVKVSDGSLREMRCTLDPALLPQREMLAEYEIIDNPAVLKVFDLDASAWRSFRVDSVLTVSKDVDSLFISD